VFFGFSSCIDFLQPHLALAFPFTLFSLGLDMMVSVDLFSALRPEVPFRFCFCATALLFQTQGFFLPKFLRKFLLFNVSEIWQRIFL